MKQIKYIFRIALITSFISLTSCNDWFELYPESETILEDYWKDGDDVLSVVGACYRGMNQAAFVDRLITWGEVRSDNVIKGQNTEDNLTRILNLTLTSDNGYTTWTEFYNVINNCNSVIYYAPGVRANDPNYTEGQLQSHISEAKAIRALCYFILLRTFRDIPLITEPTIDDTKPLEAPQSSPEEVLDFLINDLISVENNAIIAYNNNPAYDKGRITQKAIRALIADMYLWKNDYDNCIAYCDKILQDVTLRLELESSLVYNQNVFVLGNSRESIFELQFSDLNVANTEVFNMYSKIGFSGNAGFKLSSFDFINKTTLFGEADLRGKDAFLPIESSGFFPIMKYVTFRQSNVTGAVREADYMYMGTSPNWIFYRLPDIYLMKAEALVEKGGDANLREAFGLVGQTYDRANPDLGAGSLSFESYGTQALMRNLVFDERQREFLFEGKRYYDLLRRINREGTPSNVVNTYLMRKYIDLDQATANSKINDINALYMPINDEEIRINTLLVQNPFYVKSSGIEKN